MTEKLKAYHAKRDFSRTAEPPGAEKAAPCESLYVMHKHSASHDHFDLRLEQNGVLRSWALPKGPSLKPGEKRLAVEVEDHPMEYGKFEGVIPDGEYGAGTVLLWDRGHWRLVGKAKPDKLDFELQGEKLHGHWTLVKMRGKPSSRDKSNKDSLLIKRSETREHPLDPDDLSVASGRTMEEIAGGDERFRQEKGTITKKQEEPLPDPALLEKARKRPMPAYHSGRHRTWLKTKCTFHEVFVVGGYSRASGSRSGFGALLLGAFGKNGLEYVSREKDGGASEFVYVKSAGDLVTLVQFGVLELHFWGSLISDVEAPDTLIFDLDPGPNVPWRRIVSTTVTLRDLKDRLQG